MLVAAIFLVGFGCVLCQEKPPPSGPIEPAGDPSLCRLPKSEPEPQINFVKGSGKYPKSEINRAIRLSKGYKANWNFVKRSTCDCYRKNGKARGDADGDTDGPPDREGVPMPKPPPFFIRDTCPAYTKWFEWSSPFEWYNGQTCWVLNYFNKMRCPYKWCSKPFQSCSGVTSSGGIDFCAHTHYKYRWYYIWCPKSGLVLRYVRMPQCCSCMYLSCKKP